ncbi:S9 family peptidase [Steroidobacter sp.]|uniref:S9 family peptidase n=1 Tax=Steroidobacter sp. TaxID=1978227 RepID=UPI001A38A6AB|nr:DPP IV N-terminal domain-containing protein [Steroidobacter sp.]MBL8265976.1 DPP IV N-terminal domain-containing protein [Steroidobacter sp.]
MKNRMTCAALALALLAAAVSSSADMLENYRRAESYLAWHARKLVLNEKITPTWTGPDTFWYRSQTVDGHIFQRVDARRQSQAPAFDHERLASALSSLVGVRLDPKQLPFDRLSWSKDGRTLQVGYQGKAAGCTLDTYVCSPVDGKASPPVNQVRSADGRWLLDLREFNLILTDAASGTEFALTDDGVEDYGYADGSELKRTTISDRSRGLPSPPVVLFSPDSKKILTYRLDMREVRRMHLLQDVPGGAPVLHSYHYALAGDAHVPRAELMIFDLETRRRIVLDAPALQLPTPLSLTEFPILWSADSASVFFSSEERGSKQVDLYAADATTGKSRVLLQERSATYRDRGAAAMMRLVPGRNELIWVSESSGWNHLYRVDIATGAIKNAITSGDWLVREIVHVDGRGQWIYFLGAGREAGRDPYYRHLYRVKLDGSRLQLLTPEDADHTVQASRDGKYFVDTFSRVDAPPVTTLRAADGAQVMTVARADISALLATGWKSPERFTVKARDGVTDLFGVIIKPVDFDPSKRYPVIDSIYPGPQITRVQKKFTAEGERQDQAIAQLGFIVVAVDGMGTPNRSKAFHDVSYANMGDAGGLEDHISALRQLAARHPYMDVERVGIYGDSGGGYASVRALLKYPEFFKVGVAGVGNYDQRSYLAAWGERFQGYPVEQGAYESISNLPLAPHLQGKLLLMMATMDDNVHPTNTLQMIDALVAANKDFDLVVLPNRSHALNDVSKPQQPFIGADGYYTRRRWDFFVKHLLGTEPPQEYRISTPGSRQ